MAAPQPLPYRVSFPFLPLLNLEGAAGEHHDRLVALAADLWKHVVFEHLVRHPIVAASDPDDQHQVAWGDDDIAEQKAERDKQIDWQFAESRRDELLYFDVDLDPAATPNMVLNGVTRAGRVEPFLSGQVGPGALSDALTLCLQQWLAARDLGPAPRPIEPFTTRMFLEVVGVLDQILEAVHVEDEARVIALGSGLTTLAVPALRLVCAEMNGPWEAALEQRVMQLEPDNPVGLRNEFFRLLNEKGEAQDRNFIRQVLAVAPQWGKPHLSMHGKDVGEEGALRHQGIAAQLLPSNPWALDNYGINLMEAGRHEEAFRYFDRAVRVSPLFEKSYQNCMRASRAIGRPGEAFIDITQTRWRFYPAWRDSGHEITDQMLVTIGMAQIKVANAHMDVGRLEDAIETYRRVLPDLGDRKDIGRTFDDWLSDPDLPGTAYAREGHHRRDPGRVVHGFGCGKVENSSDVAMLIHALIALGKQELAQIAWAHYVGADIVGAPAARLAGARAYFLNGNLDKGIEQLWIAALRAPQGRWESEINRLLRLAAVRPLAEWETVVQARLDAGATRMARLMARDAADFVPGATGSAVLAKALLLGQAGPEAPFDKEWMQPLRVALGPEVAAPIDAFFGGRVEADQETADLLASDWPQLLGAMDAEDPTTGARALYLLGESLCRYLAATTGAPNVLASGYRQIATEALAVVAKSSLADGWTRPLLECVERAAASPAVDYWVLDQWVLRVERALQIEERSGGAAGMAPLVDGLRRVGQSLRGDERVGFEHRRALDLKDDPARVHEARFLMERCLRAFGAGAGIAWSEIADRCLPAAQALDVHWVATTATPGNAVPWIALARRLFELSKKELAYEALVKAFPPTSREWRQARLAELKPLWESSGLGAEIPFEWQACSQRGMVHLQRGEYVQAVKCLRWCDAIDSGNAALLKNLGIVYGRQGALLDAVVCFSKIDRKAGPMIAGQALLEAQKYAEGVAAYRYASMYFTGAEQWLALGGAAWFLQDDEIAAEAYSKAYELAGGRFDPSQLHAYATSLNGAGLSKQAEPIANQLIQAAGNDATFFSCGVHHMARALLAQRRAPEAVPYAERAVQVNPLPDNKKEFDETLDRARRNDPYPVKPLRSLRRETHGWKLLEASDPLGAQQAADQGLGVSKTEWPLWRVKLVAAEARFDWDNEAPAKEGLKAAWEALAATAGADTTEAALARVLALKIREQVLFPTDVVVPLGKQVSKTELDKDIADRRARSTPSPAGKPVLASVPADDPIVFPNEKISRLSDYVGLLKAMQTGDPMSALASHGLDMAAYAPLANMWSQRLHGDQVLTDKFQKMMQG